MGIVFSWLIMQKIALHVVHLIGKKYLQNSNIYSVSRILFMFRSLITCISLVLFSIFSKICSLMVCSISIINVVVSPPKFQPAYYMLYVNIKKNQYNYITHVCVYVWHLRKRLFLSTRYWRNWCVGRIWQKHYT